MSRFFNVEVYSLTYEGKRRDCILKGKSLNDYLVHTIIEQYGTAGYYIVIVEVTNERT